MDGIERDIFNKWCFHCNIVYKATPFDLELNSLPGFNSDITLLYFVLSHRFSLMKGRVEIPKVLLCTQYYNETSLTKYIPLDSIHESSADILVHFLELLDFGFHDWYLNKLDRHDQRGTKSQLVYETYPLYLLLLFKSHSPTEFLQQIVDCSFNYYLISVWIKTYLKKLQT